ncbi:MAG: hypothetical protein WB799_18910 [Candidatus Sulfotelmatobacter sp.]
MQRAAKAIIAPAHGPTFWYKTRALRNSISARRRRYGRGVRATDKKLGRDVALKVLPAEMAYDPERLGRFRREAKTLAQLDHPSIVTIY